jgi:hypothetical protein
MAACRAAEWVEWAEWAEWICKKGEHGQRALRAAPGRASVGVAVHCGSESFSEG